MTGFIGRMGLYELLTVTEAFKDKVVQGAQPHGRSGARP
jgi:general secretion pathway protein E